MNRKRAANAALGVVLCGRKSTIGRRINRRTISQSATLDTALTAALDQIPASDATRKGIEVGKAAATGILILRAGDGAGADESYRPWTTPGAYVPTVLPISFDGWADDALGHDGAVTIGVCKAHFRLWSNDARPSQSALGCSHSREGCVSARGRTTHSGLAGRSPPMPSMAAGSSLR